MLFKQKTSPPPPTQPSKNPPLLSPIPKLVNTLITSATEELKEGDFCTDGTENGTDDLGVQGRSENGQSTSVLSSGDEDEQDDEVR